jgi:hypothetical protein
MDLNAELSIPPQVVSRLVGDETVILNLESGMYFGLDGVGKRIWESIEAGNSLTEIVSMIAAEYDVEAQQAEGDLLEFVTELVERGLLQSK